MHRKRYLLSSYCLAAALAAVACGNKTSSKNGSSTVRATASEIGVKLLSAVPEDAALVAVLDAPMSLWGAALDSMAADDELWKKHRAALDKELGEFISQRLGLEFRGLQSLVAFAKNRGKNRPNVSVVIGNVGGKLKGETTEFEGAREVVFEKTEDGDIVASHKGTLLIIGDRESARAAHKAIGLGSPSASPLVKRIEETAPGAYVGIAVNAKVIAEAIGPLPLPPLDDVVVSVRGRNIRTIARGPKDSLDQIATMIEQGTSMALGQLAQQKTKATSPGSMTIEGIAAIYGHHVTSYYVEALKPVVKGDSLTMSIDIAGGDMWIWVSVVGIASAVAIPAFMKYIKKSKTSEARQFLKKLYDGARVYYMTSAQSVAARAPSFPAESVGPTPALGTCCRGEDGKCPINAAQWQHPTWQALQFSVDDPHYYSYEYKVENGGRAFEVSAYGDLDCDGNYSTFRMKGRASQGDVEGATNGPVIENELE